MDYPPAMEYGLWMGWIQLQSLLMKEEKEEKIDVQVEALAYRKIVYHLLRYPTAKVTGVLAGSPLAITNAYPLFHTPLVNPTFSLALDLIEANLKEGEAIVGFYEFVEGSEPKIISLVETNPALKDMLTMRVWVDGDQQVRLGAARFNFKQPQWSVVEAGLRAGDYRVVVDMDAHLEEIELDFTNAHIQ